MGGDCPPFQNPKYATDYTTYSSQTFLSLTLTRWGVRPTIWLGPCLPLLFSNKDKKGKAASMLKTFEKSKWYNLLTENAMLQFIFGNWLRPLNQFLHSHKYKSAVST